MPKGQLIEGRQQLMQEDAEKAKKLARNTSRRRQLIADCKRRPTTETLRSPAFQREFAELLANGVTLKNALAQYGLNYDKYHNYRKRDKAFAELCDSARDCGFDAIADECMQIADEPMESKTQIMQAKLRIETRIELLSRWSRRYSTRQQLEVNDKRDVETMLRERFAKRVAESAPAEKPALPN